MRTSLAGKRNRTAIGKRAPHVPGQGGVTLLELLVVLALISIVVGISIPTMSTGIDTLRLNSAAQSVVAFINGGLNRAERRQVVVEVTIAKQEGSLSLRSSEPGFERRLDLPDGVKIESILPDSPAEDGAASRSFLLYPGGTVPGFGLSLVNRRGSQRVVRVDPITGVPQIESVAVK